MTPLARSVFSTLFAPPRASNVREMYGPRRTAFVYDFDNEDSPDTDVPTTLRRPKSECPQVRAPAACAPGPGGASPVPRGPMLRCSGYRTLNALAHAAVKYVVPLLPV